MAKHNNPTIVEDSNRIFNFKVNEQLSDEVMGPIATIPIERRANIVRRTGYTNQTTNTIYTTPADKDFYITFINLGFIKDSTSTATSIRIQATIDGVAQRLVDIPGITLTADSKSLAVALVTPIKVDRNTAITINSDTATANITVYGTIHGYTLEVTK